MLTLTNMIFRLVLSAAFLMFEKNANYIWKTVHESLWRFPLFSNNFPLLLLGKCSCFISFFNSTGFSIFSPSDSYTPAVNSYPRITPGYLPPPVPKLAISTPTAVTLNSAAYAAPVVTKYTPASAGYNAYGAYGAYGSTYDASLYAKEGYYSSPAKILSPAITKYVSTPAVATTAYAATPTAAPVLCKLSRFCIICKQV